MLVVDLALKRGSRGAGRGSRGAGKQYSGELSFQLLPLTRCESLSTSLSLSVPQSPDL